MEANLKVGFISWESKHFYSAFRPMTPKTTKHTLKTGPSFLSSPSFPQEEIEQKSRSSLLPSLGR